MRVLITGASHLAVPIAAILASAGVGHLDPALRGVARLADAAPAGLLPTDTNRPRGIAAAEAVRRELTQNAQNGRKRSDALEAAIRKLGGYPDVIGPFLGRAAAVVKALTEQAEPFDEALLGDLALEVLGSPGYGRIPGDCEIRKE